jgi:Uncharacterized protein conserved in bacteria (DUF2252)
VAGQPLLARSFDHVKVDRLTPRTCGKAARKEIEKAARKARGRTSSGALSRFTEDHDGQQYYVRQFRNMKASVALEDLKASAFGGCAGICGRLLATAHARTVSRTGRNSRPRLGDR